MNKMSRKAFLILTLIGFFLMWGLPLKLWATTYRVSDGGDSPHLDTTAIDGNWTLTGAVVVQNETAEGTANAIRIDAISPFNYTCTDVKGSDWSGYDLANLGMAMYIYSNDSSGSDTLSIAITEEDDNDGAAPGVPQTWTLTTPISLNWTGWRYQWVKIPNGIQGYEFTASAPEPDGSQANFNPKPVAATPPNSGWAAKGVTTIQMTLTNNSGKNNNIYVDRIVLSPGLATVSQIFPTDDVQPDGKTTPDIILDRAPYTISAVLSGADVTQALNRISIIHSNDSTTLLNTNAATDNDGVNGLFATPDSPPLGGSQPYTVFIMPVDANGDTGEAEVITFKVSPPSKKVGTVYNRNVTQ